MREDEDEGSGVYRYRIDTEDKCENGEDFSMGFNSPEHFFRSHTMIYCFVCVFSVCMCIHVCVMFLINWFGVTTWTRVLRQMGA